MCRENASEKLDDQRVVSSNISYALGKFMEEREGSTEEAIQFYNECLQKDQEHKESLIAMARLYQNYGESKEQCSNFCNRLLVMFVGIVI